MARFYRKRWFIGITALLIGLFVLFVALPVLGSMRLVEKQLITALEELTGHKVVLSEQPKIGVFPRLHVELKNLTLTPKLAEEAQPIFRADKVRLDLSAWSVINGKIVVQSTRLIRPSLRIPEHDNQAYIAHLISGDLYRGLRTAQILVKESPTEADFSSIRSFKIGPVSIESGAIHFGDTDVQKQGMQTLSSINGDLSANELNGPMRLAISAIWKGENIALNTTIGNLLSLSAGGFSKLDLSLQSAPLTGSFSGTIGLGHSSFAEGQTSISTPSLTSALSWLEQDILISDQLGAISLNADLRARNAQYYFDQAEVTLDDKIGTGNLEVVLEDAIPAINATLAFDTLDLQSIVDVLSYRKAEDRIDMLVSNDVMLDLRLSANTAILEPFNLQNVAASLQIKKDNIGMDINDATLFGGQIQAGLRVQKSQEKEMQSPPDAELKFLVSDVDAKALFDLVGWEQFVLNGPITLSLITEGPLENWTEFTNTSKGSITLRAADVDIDGFSLDQFLASLGKAQFFPLAFNGNSTLSVLEAKGDIASGNIRIEDFTARMGDNRIDLSGLYAHEARSLAMAGSIVAINENGERDENQTQQDFFVGGSPARPFISPIIPGRLPDLR